MKKGCFILVFFCVFYTCYPVHAAARTPEPDLISRTAVLMDADTGQILYQKNMNERMYPASTTKIMTALLASEYALPSEIATVSLSAVAIDEQDSANIGLQPGEELTVMDAIYGLLLPSGNDAANVLAEHVAGSQENFAHLMTERAHAIGAVNTRFANSHGLHDPGHYTTAHDLALITRHAMGNDDFARYFGTTRYSLPPTNFNEKRELHNFHSMLLQERDQYDPTVLGGKVGFTEEAQHTMSTVASRDGRTLICVVMYAEYYLDKYNDTQALLDFGFGSFTPHTIPLAGLPSFAIPVANDDAKSQVLVACKRDVTLLLPNGKTLADVRVTTNKPKLFVNSEQASCYISFSLAGGEDGFAGTLLKIPLDISAESAITQEVQPVSLFPPGQTEEVAAELLKSLFSGWGLILFFAAALLLFLFFLLQGFRKSNCKRRSARFIR